MRTPAAIVRLPALLLASACLAMTGCDDKDPGANDVVASVSPASGISAVVGDDQSVTITFNTDNGKPATALGVSGLASLPDGWSSDSDEFACDELATGTPCQLTLSYAPQAAGSGTVDLDYAYIDRAGTAKNGSVAISYAATTDNSVVGTANPSGTITVAVDASRAVPVTFTTDDGAAATAFSVTTDLNSLPAGWSSDPTSLECDEVASGTDCQLSLTYAPTSIDSGTLSLAFGYTDNSGTTKSGTVEIPYQATGPKLYVGQLTGELHYCSIGADGTLSDCTPTSGITATNGIAFKGDFAYVADYYNNAVSVCSVGADGSLSNCASTGSEFYNPFVIKVSGNFLYAANSMGGHTITYCSIQSDGMLSGCAETTMLGGVEGFAFSGEYAYISQPNSNSVTLCQQQPDGSLANCSVAFGAFGAPEDLAVSGNYLYVTNTLGTVSTCVLNSTNGTITSCVNSAVDYGPMGIVLRGNQAYVSTRNGLVYLCDINVSHAPTNCMVSNGGATYGLLVQLAIH